MADDIKVRVTVEADDAIKRLTDVTKAEESLAESTKELGNQSEVASEKGNALKSTFEGIKGQAMGLITAFAGAMGLNALMDQHRQYIEANNRALVENAALTRAAAEARLDLVALKGVETKEDVLFIDRTAALSGRSAGEVARSMTMAQSQLPNASDAQIKELVTEVGFSAQQTGSPMMSLMQPFVQLFEQTKSARVSSNILNETIKQAGEPDPSKIGPLLATVMGTGRELGDMTTGEAAGYTAAATGLGLGNERAVTGVERLIVSIGGKGSTAGTEIMDREGIDRSNTSRALKQITQAYREGRIEKGELEDIGGAEGLRVIIKLTDKAIEDDFYAKVDAVAGAENRPGHAVAGKARTLFTEGSVQAGNLQAKQIESEIGSVRSGDERALRADIGRKTVELILRKAHAEGLISPGDVDLKMKAYEDALGEGHDPVKAAETVEFEKSYAQAIGSIFTGQSRFGPELGQGVYEALQLGPQLDPNVTRSFNIRPATGVGSRPYHLDAVQGTDRLATDGHVTIIQQQINITGSNVDTGDPMLDISPSQIQE